MARRKNVKRIDPRYFLHEKVRLINEAAGDTPEGVADRLMEFPVTMRAGAVNDFFNMMEGDTEHIDRYPHVENHVEFAKRILQLLGEF